MNVYIFGGEKRDYLPYQEFFLKKNLKDLDNIFYLQGPYYYKKTLAFSQKFEQSQFIDLQIDNSYVQPTVKPQLLERIIRHVLNKHADGWSLFLHADCFLIEKTNLKELLGEFQGVGSFGFGAQWTLTHPDILSNTRTDLLKNQFFNVKDVTLQIPIDGINVQLYAPYFIHLDDFMVDNQDTIDRKVKILDMIKREYPQDPFSIAIRYLKDTWAWKKAGFKTRSPERIKEIFKICEGCEFFDRETLSEGECFSCGCHLDRDNTSGKWNKLARISSECPYINEEGKHEPKWGPDNF